MNIPLIDLKEQYNSIKSEIDTAVLATINSTHYINGPELEKFEKSFATYCQKGHCVGVDNGTAALYIALKCLGIKAEDEVIIPAATFVATAEAVRMCGAKIVIAEVNEKGLIDINKLTQKVTTKTKAIIPVHLYGNVCEMNFIIELGRKYNIAIIEDCAQAHGSEYYGKKVPIGDIGCFSFFPGKNLGAYGDGGAIVCDNIEFIKKCKKFSDHGRESKYLNDSEGFNFRFDEIQASILNVKIKYLDRWIRSKRIIADFYNKELRDKVFLPVIDSNVSHSYHLYTIKTSERDKLRDFLDKEGIKVGVHYPIPVHLQPAFSYLGYKVGDFPVAEKLSKEVLSIPIYPEMTIEKIYFVIDKIKEFLKNNQPK